MILGKCPISNFISSSLKIKNALRMALEERKLEQRSWNPHHQFLITFKTLEISKWIFKVISKLTICLICLIFFFELFELILQSFRAIENQNIFIVCQPSWFKSFLNHLAMKKLPTVYAISISYHMVPSSIWTIFYEFLILCQLMRNEEMRYYSFCTR